MSEAEYLGEEVDPANATGFYEVAKNPEGTATECYTRHFHVAKHAKACTFFFSCLFVHLFMYSNFNILCVVFKIL